MITIPMEAAAWRIQYSAGMPIRALADGAGWMLNFPPAGHVNYVTAHILKDISAAKSITVSGRIDGPGPFTPVSDTAPATFSLFIQRQGDDGTETMQDYRWWYGEKFTVLPCDFAQVAPLDPVMWSNVMGHRGDTRFSGFHAALKHCANIGLTFGGYSFAGHGVKGSGSFHCRSYMLA